MASKPGPKDEKGGLTRRKSAGDKGSDDRKTVNGPDIDMLTMLKTDKLEAIIGAVEAGSKGEEETPRLSSRFPFNRSKWLRKLLSRFDEYLFGRQRRFNQLLAQALRETLSFNNRLNDKSSQFSAFLNELKEKVGLSENERCSLDELYVAFEDQFRGNREDIKERQEIYLPLVKKSLEETKGEVLDIGCGRGEWLELLREEGLRGRGVDSNHFVIKQCRDRGLDVVKSDAILYLRSIPEASLGAVSCFHVVEHLSPNALIQLLDETVRTLKTGGIAIFETPNPQNVLVGSNNFYLDPTHRNPIPSPTLKFLAEARGLHRVEIMNLHPYPESFKVSGSDLAERFNEYFYGPQDYALIGHKL
jgi:O-antigen chain-terminating methyltransferase